MNIQKKSRVDTLVIEPICKNCKSFFSFRLVYEDDLEPDDCGWCKFNRHGNEGFRKEAKYHVNEEDSCEDFEACER